MRKAIWGSRVRWIWLFLVFSAAAVYPALKENVGATAYDAGTVHLYRSFVFSGAISDGVLYPRWVQFLHLGLGSPLFTFNPPLPYYALDALYRLGIAHPVGWRILIGLGLLAAAAGAFQLVFLLTGRKWPALLAGAAYLYAPYVLRNALERGSLETFSMFLYPWILWGLLRLARRPSAGRFIVATLLWAVCIACHVLAPLMLAPFAGLLAVAAGWRHRTAAPLLALLAGGLLTAAIWLPIVPEQQNVRLELDFENPQATPLYHPTPLDSLLAGPTVYDVQSGNNYSGEGVGLLQTVFLVLGLPATVYAWCKRRRELAVALAAATLAGLFLFWMQTSASDAAWRLLGPVLTRLEFRSRWLGLESLAAAAAAGLALALLPARWQRSLAAAAAALLVLAALPSLYVNLLHHYGLFEDSLSWTQVRQAEILSGGSAFTSWNEFAPRWRSDPYGAALAKQLGPDFDAEKEPLANPPAGVTVKSARVRSSDWDLALDVAQPVSVTLHLLYYPRWQATVDGSPAPVRVQRGTGFVQVALPAGSHRLVMSYATTAAEWAGYGLSALTLLGLIGAGVAGLLRRRARPAKVAEPVTGTPPDDEPGALPPGWLLATLTALVVVKFAYVDPDTTWLRCASTAGHICGSQTVLDIPFDNAPRLRGYAISSGQVRRGADLKVNLIWQGSPDTRPRLYSFIHIRNSQKGWPVNPRTNSEIWAQDEHESPGRLFATEFSPDRLYTDEFRLTLPADLPPGQYYLEVGWFDPASGEQLAPRIPAGSPVKELWRSILLPSIEVR